MKEIQALRERMHVIKAKGGHIRNRQLAQMLDISEAELLTLSIGKNVVRLAGDFKSLLVDLKEMGYVMALTRNEACVHERKGVYENITFYDGPHNMGVAVNPDIDLRFFMNQWAHGLAVIMDRGKMGKLYSFQFFNENGEAVHKVFSTPKSDLGSYDKIVEKYRAEAQEPLYNLPKAEAQHTTEIPDQDIDVASFQSEWLGLQDTHDFFGMVRKYELSRTQALRLAPAGHSEEVPIDSVEKVLEYCAEENVSIMCFVNSKGCIQIHTGPVNKLKRMNQWYNVLDPTFNLHLDTDQVKQAWVVRKPTADGMVTSLELFDADGQLVVYFFGERKPGKPELDGWRAAIDLLQTATTSETA